MSFKVKSDKVSYTKEYITSEYRYESTDVNQLPDGSFCVSPKHTNITFKTARRIPKIGVMLVGIGGNNGTTVVGAVLANKHGISFRNKTGVIEPNYFGSVTQSSTVSLGTDSRGKEIYIPLGNLLPMVHPNDIEFDGWDISKMNLADAMERAQVLEWDLQRQLRPYLEKMIPRPSIYIPDFIAANQSDRADNVLTGLSKSQMVERIRGDIQDFKRTKRLDKVIVLWTANTERFSSVLPGLNSTADELLESIERGHEEISPSSLFAVACIKEKVTFINGSPQNAFVPGVVELAEREGSFIAGDDFKSGQTKVKSVLVDFLVGAGLKPTSIVSYNHLGNNDGKNLSAPQQFRSKEISKSNVVDDMVASNDILYTPGEKPDHCVVIKYVPYVGDSKRAMDEYTSELMLGGKNTLVLHNTCEDSLLASPIILDLVILAEVCERISFRPGTCNDWQTFHSVLSILSYLCKAPMVPEHTPVVNALFKQRACIENVFRACVGMPPINHMTLEHKTSLAAEDFWSTPKDSVVETVSSKTQQISRTLRLSECEATI